jgi:hypothetical protein
MGAVDRPRAGWLLALRPVERVVDIDAGEPGLRRAIAEHGVPVVMDGDEKALDLVLDRLR